MGSGKPASGNEVVSIRTVDKQNDLITCGYRTDCLHGLYYVAAD